MFLVFKVVLFDVLGVFSLMILVKLIGVKIKLKL